MPTSRLKPLLPPTALLLLALLIFSPLLLPHGSFFLDDHELITRNPLFHSPNALYDIWFSGKTPDFFPLTSSLFYLEYQLFGDQTTIPYHLLNLLLHASSAILLYKILQHLRIPGPFLAALLFLIHPVNAESASWIAEGKNTLSLSLMLASLLAFLKSESSHTQLLYSVSLILFLAALLAKTAVVMFPFTLLLLALFQRHKIALKDLLRAAPFFLLSLLLGLLTIYFQYNNSINDTIIRTDPLLARLLNAPVALAFYLSKALLPLHISFNYAPWPTTPITPLSFIPLALLMLLFTLLLLFHKKTLPLLLSLSIYILMLLPMLGFLNIFFMRYALVSDHWQYHALPALLALLAAALVTLYQKSAPLLKKILLPAGLALATILALYTSSIANVYRSEESIWLDTLSHNPSSWLAHANLGELYLTQSQSDPAQQKLPLAIDHLHAVVQLQPDRTLAYINLANAYILANQPALAAQTLTQGLAAPSYTKLDHARLLQALGNLAARSQNFPLAQSYFQQALQLAPDSFSLHFALGATYFHLHQLELARDQLNRALKLDPSNPLPRAFLQQMTPPLPATNPLSTLPKP